MNKVALVGNLTRDPETRQTQSGQSACNFTVACQRHFKNAEGKYDADFIPCVAWRQTADFVAKYFKKGSKIGLTGSIQTRSYDKDGQKRYVTEVVVDEVEFVTSAADKGESAAAPALPAPDADGLMQKDDDDLPF